MENNSFKYIDLFAGAGGLSLGFEKLSNRFFKAVWANDFDFASTQTYDQNFDSGCDYGDIVSFLENPEFKVPECDIVIGGPPCQGFSLLNKKRADDPRKKLWIPYMEVVERSGAKAFVMENVVQLIGSLEHEEVIDWAEHRGFKVWSGVLLAADYGVPQIRRRGFVIGSKINDPCDFFPPLKTHYNPQKTPDQLSLYGGSYIHDAKPWTTVREAISDLPPPTGTEISDEVPPMNLHFRRNPTEKSIARYKAIPEEGMNRFDLQRVAPELTPDCWIRKKSGGTDLFGRLWWDRPAFTIRTEFFKPEKGRYLHPEQHRPITHREAARFQTFPDKFIFKGSKIEIARQIGNAVPPLLAAKVAEQVYQLLMNNKNSQDAHIPNEKATRDFVSHEESVEFESQ